MRQTTCFGPQVPFSEKTDKDYDVTGPDKDGHVAVEWDVDTNIIWLSYNDCKMMLKRFKAANAGGQITPVGGNLDRLVRNSESEFEKGARQ